MKYTYKAILIVGLSVILGQTIVSCSGGYQSSPKFEKTFETKSPKEAKSEAAKSDVKEGAKDAAKPASAPLPNTTVQKNNAPARAKSEGMAAPNPKKIAADKSNVSEDKKPTGEGYDLISENPFYSVVENPLSTFSIDVDTASYSNVRRFINEGQLPPKDAVRLEEMINYFKYDYPQSKDEKPFSVNTEISQAPWNPSHKLVQIGLQGKNISTENLPPNNLVFLIDVSGSMNEPNKLPLLKSSLQLLVNELRANDKVSIVVYAGNAGLVLPATPGNQKEKILNAINQLEAGGSTAGGEGIQLAYKIAKENFIKSGNNRIILASDGDFNVGISNDNELVSLIEKQRDQGIFLTILGVGMGNFQDSKMQKLADKGNGNYAYIDSLMEANKVLVKQMGGTLLTIAKDVKIQVEFNPRLVQGYRLVGYEKRLLAKQDFNDDKKDAGEIGAGHQVTALYEIIPVGVKSDVSLSKVDDLKYQKPAQVNTAYNSNELMQVKLRYKQPKENNSQLVTIPVINKEVKLQNASTNFKFASSVAAFGMVLRDSRYKGTANFEQVLTLARQSQGVDLDGYRAEFIRLVDKSKSLKGL
jgi:Ca-activated chloride channel homolog